MIHIPNKPTAKIININTYKVTSNNTPCVKMQLPKVSNIVNIKARGKFPANVLSNFAPTDFTFDGVKIKSIEGFLQSLKIKDPEKQKYVCSLDGFEAKKFSKSIKRNDKDILMFWKGKSFTQGSEEFKQLKKSLIETAKKSGGEHFEFQGVEVGSIGAFLMSLKVKNPVLQDKIRILSGHNVEHIAHCVDPEYAIRDLYWNGKTIKRDSVEYKKLLDEVYNKRFENDFMFREALRATEGKTLEHTRGKSDITQTVLTREEFLEQLNKLRSRAQAEHKTGDFFKRIMSNITNPKKD
ncbi:MAG: hypothetical protein SPL70_04365 [Cyanobacteriota bacterium]|nr:hypothetical protein [Cyanobacteriota bacterium]MDY6358093.1 hypothetical protein [Cyanobacteriota bacterium]MDY6383118.1 hypothetical protein [Cyanobacteriota bacterium]